MNTDTDKTPDYGEPWSIDPTDGFLNKVVSAEGECVSGLRPTRRAIQCVNACAGMADPAAEIAELRSERDEARAELAAMREAVKEITAILAKTPDAYDSRFFRAGQWADAALAKLQPFIK